MSPPPKKANLEAVGATPTRLWTVNVVLFLHVNLGLSRKQWVKPRKLLFWVGVTLDPGRRLHPPPPQLQSSSRVPDLSASRIVPEAPTGPRRHTAPPAVSYTVCTKGYASSRKVAAPSIQNFDTAVQRCVTCLAGTAHFAPFDGTSNKRQWRIYELSLGRAKNVPPSRAVLDS